MPKPKINLRILNESILYRFDRIEGYSTESGQRSSTPLAHGDFNHSIPRLVLDADANGLSKPHPLQEAANANSNQDISPTLTHRVSCRDGDIWLAGSALLCSCPDCNAPMTIRVWLGLADCWRCQTSISLTEEQIHAVNKLIPKTKLRQTSESTPLPFPARKTVELTPQPMKNLPKSNPEERWSEDELESLSRTSSLAHFVRNGFVGTPAWLVSLIIHVIVILILGLIVFRDQPPPQPTITLSTSLSSDDRLGGEIRFENPANELRDDFKMASDMTQGEDELRQFMEKANRDAKSLQTDPIPLAPLKNIEVVKKNITTNPDRRMSFEARDPRIRSEIVRKEGGTTLTEAAVARGLRWLVSVQNSDGGWSLKNYSNHKNPNNASDIMATSLALLPLLGSGQTHEFGIYKSNVAAGLAWLIKRQKSNGDLRAGFSGQAGMYAHGQASIVLCEAYAMTGDQAFQQPAQNAIQFIESAQHGKGGWRYQPGQPGDTSVFGWQMMALQSAQAPNIDLEINASTLKLADYFLDQVSAPASFARRRNKQLPTGSAYAYLPGKSATAAMTAEAILCRMYLGWKKDDPRLSVAVKWLIDDHLPSKRSPNLYYWYYGTQVMHHYGGDSWETWNRKMRELLISTQNTRGSNSGSWDPGRFEWGTQGGRIYTTALAVCTLEVYYRHLPLFDPIELNSVNK
ncbi:MAG: prenyltransferase/squalene oxidase repeat-containing protein [Mariniblastus sp.]